MVGLAVGGIAALQRMCDHHLRRSQVLHLSMLFLAPVVLVLAVVATISGLVEPFLAIVPAVPLYFLLMSLDSANDSNCQRARDRQATLIVSVIREGGDVDFALYLRGDVTDDRLDDESYDPQYGRHYQKTEKGLANALQPIAPLIAIGGKPSTVGAGRCPVQKSEWQGVVSQLMERARVLFFLPWFTPGVAWEAQEVIHRGLLQRTIFVMPKRNPPLVTRENWQQVQSTMRALGLHLPDYNYWGMLFTLDQDGRVKESAYLPGMDWKGMRKAVVGLGKAQGMDLKER